MLWFSRCTPSCCWIVEDDPTKLFKDEDDEDEEDDDEDDEDEDDEDGVVADVDPIPIQPAPETL